jgi:DNA-binding CsgD family transcriptional regulator
LSDRQCDVLGLMAENRTNYEIAQTLGLSLEGAKYHVSEILAKLGVESREEAIELWRTSNGFTAGVLRRMRGLWPLGALLGTAGVAAAVTAALYFGAAETGGGGMTHVWIAVSYAPAAPEEGWKLEVIDATAGTRRFIGAPGSYAAPFWSPDGSRLVVLAVDSSPPELRFFNARTWGEPEGSVPLEGLVQPAGWSPDSKSYAVTGAVTRVYGRDGNRQSEVRLLAPGESVTSSSTGVWSPDSRRLIARVNDRVFLIDRGGHSRELAPPEDVAGAGSKLFPLRWIDANRIVVVDSSRIGAWFEVDISQREPAWTPTSDAFGTDTTDLLAVLTAMRTASPGDQVSPGGTTADGRGKVFLSTHMAASAPNTTLLIEGAGVRAEFTVPANYLRQHQTYDAVIAANR